MPRDSKHLPSSTSEEKAARNVKTDGEGVGASRIDETRSAQRGRSLEIAASAAAERISHVLPTAYEKLTAVRKRSLLRRPRLVPPVYHVCVRGAGNWEASSARSTRESTNASESHRTYHENGSGATLFNAARWRQMRKFLERCWWCSVEARDGSAAMCSWRTSGVYGIREIFLALEKAVTVRSLSPSRLCFQSASILRASMFEPSVVTAKAIFASGRLVRSRARPVEAACGCTCSPAEWSCSPAGSCTPGSHWLRESWMAADARRNHDVAESVPTKMACSPVDSPVDSP
eukprot:4696745-Pleurochrysis_carterae.AAC.1